MCDRKPRRPGGDDRLLRRQRCPAIPCCTACRRSSWPDCWRRCGGSARARAWATGRYGLARDDGFRAARTSSRVQLQHRARSFDARQQLLVREADIDLDADRGAAIRIMVPQAVSIAMRSCAGSRWTSTVLGWIHHDRGGGTLDDQSPAIDGDAARRLIASDRSKDHRVVTHARSHDRRGPVRGHDRRDALSCERPVVGRTDPWHEQRQIESLVGQTKLILTRSAHDGRASEEGREGTATAW
jgi:hypothetical protein